jgi:hypothetical protein
LDTATVENSQIRVVFATNGAVFLRQLIQKPSGKNLLAEPANSNLFSMTVSRPAGGEAIIESQQAKQASLKVMPFAGGCDIQIEFTGLSAGNLRVKLAGRLPDSEPTIRWSVAVDHLGEQRLLSFRFPYVVAVAAIGNPDDDFIVAPALPGVMIENPARNMTINQTLFWSFPGFLSAQFCSYQDRTAGVYLASLDTGGNVKALRITKQPDGYLICHEFRSPQVRSSKWVSPYEVALGVTSGAWFDTADIYKRWAVGQPWCAQTLAQRKDIPDSWKQGPCVYTCEARTYDANKVCTGSNYPKLLQHLQSLRTMIDGPVVPMVAGWENHRRWTAGDYFPVFDATNAQSVLGQLRSNGFPPFLYLSGLCFTYTNGGPDASAVPGAERYAGSFVTEEETQKPKTDILKESKGFLRYSYEFCPAAPDTKKFYRSAIDQLHVLGVDIVQMDQTTWGAGDVCYSTAHGHQPGPGAYQAEAFHELLRDMRQYGRSLSPSFLLTHEEVHEELIPYLDGFHTREFKEHDWYRRETGARGIPLFTYLYHEYAIAYGGDGPLITRAKDPVVVWQLAINFVTGKTPAMAVWGDLDALAQADPNQIRLVANHVKLLKNGGQKFLMLGRMLHPLEFESPQVTMQMLAKQGLRFTREPFLDHAVLTSSWQAPDMQVGHVFVNFTGTKQKIHFQLDTRNAPGWTKADVDLYRTGQTNGIESLHRDVVLPCDQTLELDPLEGGLLVLRPSSLGSASR